MKVWRGEGVFTDFLKADLEVAAVLTLEELVPLPIPTRHFVHVGAIFRGASSARRRWRSPGPRAE